MRISSTRLIGKCQGILVGAVLIIGIDVCAQWSPEGGRMGKMTFGGPENSAVEFLQSYDADGDGQIDKAEFSKASEAMFQLMDLSGDGKIDAEEIRRDPAAIYGDCWRRAGQIVDRYDTDEDEKLSAQEAPFGAMAFIKGDVNKDSRLDRRELAQLALEVALLSDALRIADSPAKAAQAFLKKYDKNRDGRITLDEFEWGEAWFGQYDQNSDKFLDEQEIARMPPLPRSPKAQAKDLLKQRDKNGDGRLSAEESGEPPERFHAADTNADGQLSLEELTALIAQRFVPPRLLREKRLEGAPEPVRLPKEMPAQRKQPAGVVPQPPVPPGEQPVPKVAPLPAPVAP